MLRAALLLVCASTTDGFKLGRVARRASPQPPRAPVPRAKVPRTVNLSAGCSALPPHILEKCAAEFVNYIGRDGKQRGLSIAEMGYRTNDFYELMHDDHFIFIVTEVLMQGDLFQFMNQR